MRLYQFLLAEGWARDRNLSSRLLSRWLGVTPETLRRDLAWLGGDHAGSVWTPEELLERLRRVLALPGEVRTALVGLDDWSVELFLRPARPLSGLRVVACFDSRQNRLETVDTDLPLYPSVELPQRVEQLGIEAAILTLGPQLVPRVAERLAGCRLKGVLNLSGYPLRPSARLRVVDGSVPHLWGRLVLELGAEQESDHGKGL